MAPVRSTSFSVGFLLLLGPALALAIAGCGSKSETSTSPSPVKCQVALTSPQSTLDPGGGAGSVAVSTQAECAWTASTTAAWITNLTPTSGQGSGTVQFQASANSGTSPRQADIVLNGTTIRISQSGAPCRIDISPRSQTIEAAGGTGSVSVTALPGCAWSAVSGAPWLTITSGASGTADGAVAYSVTPNAGAARLGVLTIADQTFVVTQQSPTAPQCSYVVSPTSATLTAAGGSSPVSITTGPSCSWTAASNEAWLAVVGVGTGTGTGTVTISATANTGATRTGTLMIAGQTFTVTQAGSCAASLSPTSTAVSAAGGAGIPIAVTISAGCAWTAAANDAWLSITSGASGNGNGTVTFTVAANTGLARSGTLTIANQVFAVDQAMGCSASISPTSQTVAVGGGAGTPIAVTTATGCAWTATTGDHWITITSGASGSGNGTVNFTTAANTGAQRVGTIAIAGQIHTVTQTAVCTIALNPASQTVGAAGGAGTQIAVTAGSGCAWTATTADNWLTITSGASGSGNGAVDFTAAANTGPQRVGTITIGGQPHTVTQTSGCVFSINPQSHTFPNDNPATGPTINVTTAAGCTWTTVSNASWITIASGATGTGNGSATFTVNKNNTGVDRTGTITIAGVTFTVTQPKQ
jgi:hypothetical protein